MEWKEKLKGMKEKSFWLKSRSKMKKGVQEMKEKGKKVGTSKEMVDPRPSTKEIEEHMREHIPYRNWCHHCVAGRGISDRHNRESEIGDIPVIGMDYFYLHENGEERKQIK